MSKCLCMIVVHACRKVVAAGNFVLWSICCSWQTLRFRNGGVPMEILVADRGQRRRITCRLLSGLRQLQRVLGTPVPADVAIVVQQIIATDRQLVGCYQLGQRPDGAPYALLRLALQVNGRRLSNDELLAALAEQWIAVATQRNSPGVLVAVDFEPSQLNPASGSSSLRPDPLIPCPDGQQQHRV